MRLLTLTEVFVDLKKNMIGCVKHIKDIRQILMTNEAKILRKIVVDTKVDKIRNK